VIHAHLLAHRSAGEAQLVAGARAAFTAQQFGLDGVGVGLGQVRKIVAERRSGPYLDRRALQAGGEHGNRVGGKRHDIPPAPIDWQRTG